MEATDGPPKNERVARREAAMDASSAPLDRASRRRRLTIALRRAVAITWRAMLVGLVVVAVAYVGQALESFVRTSPAFSLEEIVVRGESRLTEDEVIAASGIARGENIFNWPPEDVEAKLTSHPWIARASAKRKLPARFEIEIREHAPRALLLLGSLYLVSREGVVFKEVAKDEHFDLPVVTIENGDAVRTSRERRGAVLPEVAALLRDVEVAQPSWSATLAEVHVHEDGAFTLRFGDAGTEVRLGKGEIDGKLARLRRVFERLERAGVEASRIYADNERRPDRMTVELR
jgi:cell division protein FtsQ